mgnify:CR=1 FL=1
MELIIIVDTSVRETRLVVKKDQADDVFKQWEYYLENPKERNMRLCNITHVEQGEHEFVTVLNLDNVTMITFSNFNENAVSNQV